MKKKLAFLRAYLQKLFCCQIPTRYLNTVYFPHPIGVVIGSEVRIGSHVTIYQNVTIGRFRQDVADPTDYPVLSDYVTVYAGAVIIGGITIGHHSIIGANAVISRDVPPYSIAYGYNQIKPIQK